MRLTQCDDSVSIFCESNLTTAAKLEGCAEISTAKNNAQPLVNYCFKKK